MENRPRSLPSAAGSDSPRITPSCVPVLELLLVDVSRGDVHAPLGHTFLMIIDPDLVPGIPGAVGRAKYSSGSEKVTRTFCRPE